MGLDKHPNPTNRIDPVTNETAIFLKSVITGRAAGKGKEMVVGIEVKEMGLRVRVEESVDSVTVGGLTDEQGANG